MQGKILNIPNLSDYYSIYISIKFYFTQLCRILLWNGIHLNKFWFKNRYSARIWYLFLIKKNNLFEFTAYTYKFKRYFQKQWSKTGFKPISDITKIKQAQISYDGFNYCTRRIFRLVVIVFAKPNLEFIFAITNIIIN